MEWENLDLCQRVVDEIIEKLWPVYRFRFLVHCGDWKRQYNPIDTRMINASLKMLARFREAGIEVLVDLGNHDRTGLYVDKQNWLPILRKGGARCFDEPYFVDVDGPGRIALLPYRQDPVLLKREAYDLARGAKPDRDILVFHSDLASARYNLLGANSTGAVHVKDLCPERYVCCVGGHIHLQQKLAGNVWYVGSPFATDWGEANQKKGYLLYDFGTKELKRIPSMIPGWFDPSWPRFWEPKSWQGARVRIQVPVGSTKHIQEELRRAQEAAEKKYRGAEIIVVPRLEAVAERAGHIQADWTDRKKIEKYVLQTIPDELKRYSEKTIAYLVEQLQQTGGLVREGGALTFQAFSMENVLSFKKLKVKLEPGLCVVTGENRDRQGKSNGSGKTSYLQPLALALFGTTFKRQKHDAWMHRWIGKKEPSRVHVYFRDSQGRECIVARSRRPVYLRLWVGRQVLESGNRPEDTQRLIEQVTGYTWETLSNAVYIDQGQAHLMLTGTEAQRKTFLARLQNLERFEKALKRVKVEKSDLDVRYAYLNSQLAGLCTDVSSLDSSIADAEKILAPDGDLRDLWRVKKRAYLEVKQEFEDWEDKAQKKTAQLTGAWKEEDGHEKYFRGQLETIRFRSRQLADQIQSLMNMKGTCPTCLQEVTRKHVQEWLPGLKMKGEGLLEQAQRHKVAIENCQSAKERIEDQKNRWIRNVPLAKRVALLSEKVAVLQEKVKQQEQQEGFIRKLQARKKVALEAKEKLEERIGKIKRWLEVVKYAETVFARNGLPAYLNAQICPQLNQAAEKYAELFTQREIQVQFGVDEEGQLDVQIINANGGETVDAQSEGEMKVASLITSFAVREVAPKTNLLILDEPGDGLDGPSARQFARGLKEIAGQFSTILLTSHNPNIISELADAKQVRIVKQNGVSHVA